MEPNPANTARNRLMFHVLAHMKLAPTNPYEQCKPSKGRPKVNESTMRVHPRTVLALARGELRHPDGSTCASCGESPFSVGKPSGKVFGPNFTSYAEMARPHAEWVCAGCVSLLGGRPGDDPPPLRTMNACATVHGISYPGAKELGALLKSPPSEPHVLVWATSRKRHAFLHAGVSDSERQVVGADAGPIVVERRHLVVLDAVEHMVGYANRAEVAAGEACVFAAVKAGPDRWAAWLDTVRPYVGLPLLDLFVAVATKIEPEQTQEDEMTNKPDEHAVSLLLPIVTSSNIRRSDGIRFWKHIFPRRLAARKGLPLADCLSRLLADLQCTPLGAVELADVLGWLEESQTTEIEAALRSRHMLIATLTYAAMKRGKEMLNA